ncbi:MAG: hypothetical protein DRP93_06830 [Candidatus Neomarinimicrobiota bacterium]|nr:MAG: hypothetical protein DRP93_06830 [Candidatus Neomarinimicrobiota bacterium]
MTDRPHGDAFRGFAISLLYLDEVAFYKHNEWEEFKDSVFPTMNSLIVKQVIATSTAKGLNHWAAIVKGARKGTNGYKIVENDWKDVPRYDKKGRLMTPEEYKEATIKKYGEVYFKSTEENSFMGSTVTLIDGEVLKTLGSSSEKYIPEVFSKMKVFKEVEKGHNYAIGVDPSGDGIDNFAIQVIDITRFPFTQVAAGGLQVDYMIMAEHISELGNYYNEAFITVETNDGIGTSIVDALWYTYEYPNLFRERDTNNKGYAKRHGFRTTAKSRNLILGTMKTFIEEEKLLICDETTINELYTFELDKDKNKYLASDGNKDDMVMSLAITFAPFTHIKVMDDHLLYLKAVRAEISDDVEGVDTSKFYSLMDVGGFDSGEEEVVDMSQQERLLRIENITDEDEQFEAIRQLNRGM